MIPSFSDFFKSFYYENTYVPAVDLSEQKYLLDDPLVQARAQKVLSDPEVQAVLSEPLAEPVSNDPDNGGEQIKTKNEIMTKHGFKLLSHRPFYTEELGPQVIPFYSATEHEALPGWVIKSGAPILPTQLALFPRDTLKEKFLPIEEDSLLRIEMANRIAQISQKEGIEVILPKERIVAFTNEEGSTQKNKKYCVLSEKIDFPGVAHKLVGLVGPQLYVQSLFPTRADTYDLITQMSSEDQRKIAKKLSTGLLTNYRASPDDLSKIQAWLS